MSRYRKVEVKTWTDDKFRSLSPMPPSGQGLWLFLITGPHTSPIPGLFRAGRAALAEELGWDIEDFDEAFKEVLDKGMAKADFKSRLVWLPKAIHFNKPESPNVVRSWHTELSLLPGCDLKNEAIAYIRAHLEAIGKPYLTAFNEAFEPSSKPSVKPSAKASAKTMPNQEQEQEQEEEQTNFVRSSSADDAPEASGVPPCPHQDIIAAYHEILPMLPGVREWTPARRTALAARWREKPERQTIAWWRKLFSYVAESDFLTGRASRGRGHDAWQCSLPWLLKPENFAKLLEGHYENREVVA